MKKYLIQSWNPIPSITMLKIEEKLNVLGTIAEKRIVGDYGCCYVLTTDKLVSATAIMNMLKPIADCFNSKIMVAKLDETEYAETPNINEPVVKTYCFSRFDGYKEALRKYCEVGPCFKLPDKTTRDMTFAEYIMCGYGDYNKKEVRYEDYLSRFLNLAR